MNCLRCANEPLTERNREGVTIDVCGACRGIWLDRGELEKLIARSEGGPQRRHRKDEPPSSDGPRRHRKKSWLDIFD
ncbi:MAG: zf-TFIIB domain-containing protein [Polyangiaceae bacterium]